MEQKVIKARVKFGPSKPEMTAHGEKINIVVTLPNGNDLKLWGTPDSALAQYKKGDEILLTYQDGRYRLVEVESTTVKPKQEEEMNLGDEMEAKIDTASQIMAKCYRSLEKYLPDLPPEVIQPMATSIFIYMTRH